MSAADAVREITAMLNRQPTPANEVEQSVAKAFNEQPIAGNHYRRKSKATFQPTKLKRVAERMAHVENPARYICERSNVVVETQNSASVLRRLYHRHGGAKILVFNHYKSQGQLLWEAANSDRIQQDKIPLDEGDGVWFLPQPVDGEFHPNPRQDNKPSRRSEESVTAWQYLVLESDEASEADWLRCLIQLPIPIVAITQSGGKSVHALVRLNADSKEDFDRQVDAMKPVLVCLGADPAALSAIRLTRLPQATRGDRNQRLLYLWPEANGMPISELETQVERFGDDYKEALRYV